MLWVRRSSTLALVVATPALPIVVLSGLPRWVVVLTAAVLVAALAGVAATRWRGIPAPLTLGLVAGCVGLVWAAVVFGFFAAWAISIDHELCGYAGPWPLLVAAGVYLGGAFWAFRGRWRPAWGWPLAVLLGYGGALVTLALLPAGHGFCET
jgi:hypothetical protein